MSTINDVKRVQNSLLRDKLSKLKYSQEPLCQCMEPICLIFKFASLLNEISTVHIPSTSACASFMPLTIKCWINVAILPIAPTNRPLELGLDPKHGIRWTYNSRSIGHWFS